MTLSGKIADWWILLLAGALAFVVVVAATVAFGASWISLAALAAA